MNRILAVTRGATELSAEWDDGRRSAFDYLWLRDNCASAFHPSTRERNFNLLSVSDAVTPTSTTLTDSALRIVWSEGAGESSFAFDWLRANDYSRLHGDGEAMFRPTAWDASYGDNIVAADYADLIESDAALLAWLLQLQNRGLVLVNAMPAEEGALEATARRIAHLRETNFGVTFDVRSKPNPNNQAYTSEALPLHTDLPNQELPPGYQFLHCLQNDAVGGDSVFVDGFAIAEALRREQRGHFDALSQNLIPFRFHDGGHDLRSRRAVIALDAGGEVDEINYNAHLAATFMLPARVMRGYYLAYRAFMRMLNDARFVARFKLAAGSMAVFDNRRVLHGRGEFNPQSGGRRLRGCYVDRGDLKSRIRVLSRA